MSILEINDDRVKELENFLETNCRFVIDKFPEYKNTKPFMFLPGHRECIFGIKTEILKLQNNKKSKTTTQRGRMLGQEELKVTLAQQVAAYANIIDGFDCSNVDWSAAIKNFEVTESETSIIANCVIDCPKCRCCPGTTFRNSWKLSNVFRHLRTHANKENHDNSKDNNNSNETIIARENSVVYKVVLDDQIDGSESIILVEQNDEES